MPTPQEMRDLLNAILKQFARSGCKMCNGKGYYVCLPSDIRVQIKRVRNKKQRPAGIPMICECAKRGYELKLKLLLPIPCKSCGTTGAACDHRPRTVREYLEVCRGRWTGPTGSQDSS